MYFCFECHGVNVCAGSEQTVTEDATESYDDVITAEQNPGILIGESVPEYLLYDHYHFGNQYPQEQTFL